MPAHYQNLLIDSLLLVSVIELALCLLAGALQKRSEDIQGLPAGPEPQTLDPFSTWINMLERQRDRREASRYGGVERRSKATYGSLLSK